MHVTRPNRPIMSVLALPLLLATGSPPAAAQSGSEAVVCVGSERRTLATNPIRRVYTEDMEIVYRIGVDIGQRDQVERVKWSRFFGQVVKVDSKAEEEAPGWPGRDGGSRRSSRHG